MKVCSRLAFLCVNASEIGSLIGTALIDDWCYVETDKVGADTILEAKSIFNASMRMGKGVFFASAGELLITAQQQATMSFWRRCMVQKGAKVPNGTKVSSCTIYY